MDSSCNSHFFFDETVGSHELPFLSVFNVSGAFHSLYAVSTTRQVILAIVLNTRIFELGSCVKESSNISEKSLGTRKQPNNFLNFLICLFFIYISYIEHRTRG